MRFMSSKNRFIRCILPLMREFISNLLIEMSDHPGKPKYLLYGSFPGNEVFFQMLDEFIRHTFHPLIVVPVTTMADIKDFVDTMDPTEEGFSTYHDHFIWFQIQDDPSMKIADFNAFEGSIREIWYHLDSRKDQTIRILATCRCRSVAIFGIEKDWEHRFMTHDLWRIVHLPIDFAYDITEEIMHRHYGSGQSRLKEYYKRFQKTVLSYEKFTRRQLHSCHFHDKTNQLIGCLKGGDVCAKKII